MTDKRIKTGQYLKPTNNNDLTPMYFIAGVGVAIAIVVVAHYVLNLTGVFTR